MATLVANSVKAVLVAPFHNFIHKDFHEVVKRMTLVDKLLFLVIISPLAYFSSTQSFISLWAIIVVS